jgi:hypothetical protein
MTGNGNRVGVTGGRWALPRISSTLLSIRKLPPLLLLLVAGCTVPSLPDRREVALRNTCATDADCGEDTCVSPGVCLASATAIRDLMLVVTKGDSSGYPSLLPITLAEDEGKQRFDLLVADPVELHVTARFEPGATSVTGCQWKTSAGGSVALRAAVLATARTRGLPTRAAFATGSPQPPASSPPEYWHLATLVPPGEYDIYLSAIDDATCPIPPLLVRATALDNERFDLKVGLEAPRPLSGTVRVPSGGSLLGYRAEIVDGATGLLLSTVGIVGSTGEDGRARFGVLRDGTFAPLEFFQPILPVGQTAKPMLRFVPPEGPPAATLLWDVAAIDITNAGVVALDVSDLATQVVDVEGRVERDDAAIGARAQIFLRSRTRGIVGEAPGVPAFFSTKVDTSADGVFHVALLAGDYDVTAVPIGDSSRTLARASFHLAAQPPTQAGRLLQFPARPAVRARVLGRFDEALDNVVVDATAVVRTPTDDAFEIARKDSPLSLAATTGLTDQSGFLELPTDATQVTLTARPEAATRFPWAVLPRVTPSATLVEVHPSNPVEVFGVAVGADQAPLPYAVIRAYARIPTPTGDGDFLPIGETVALANGSYDLLLPSHFSP